MLEWVEFRTGLVPDVFPKHIAEGGVVHWAARRRMVRDVKNEFAHCPVNAVGRIEDPSARLLTRQPGTTFFREIGGQGVHKASELPEVIEVEGAHAMRGHDPRAKLPVVQE
ncbi:hypothetical protein D3C87_1544340 [compost metagenome]